MQPRSQTPRRPRFHIGDRVKAIGPTVQLREMNAGTVDQIIGPPADAVYRYRVTFADGRSETFFGFELELIAA